MDVCSRKKTQLFLGYKYLKCVRFLPKRIFEKYYLCRSSIQERKEEKRLFIFRFIAVRRLLLQLLRPGNIQLLSRLWEMLLLPAPKN